MKRQIIRLILASLLVITLVFPLFALARVSSIDTITSNSWSGLTRSTFVEGDWLVVAGAVGSPSGSSEGCAYSFSGTTTHPEGSSLIYTTKFKTGSIPESSSQSCWFRIVLGGNLWANLFQIKAEPGQPLTMEFASSEETRFNATDFDSSNGMKIDYDTEYTMKITLKPNVGTKVKFVAELFNAEGERIGAGMIDNYSFVNTDTIRTCTGLRLVSYRSSLITQQEPIVYVGETNLSVDMPDSKPEANFYPENGSENADINGSFYMTFKDEIEPISSDDVIISGNAVVDGAEISANGKRIDFYFSSLKPAVKYDVKVKGIQVVGASKTYEYDWSFTTSYQVEYLPRTSDVLFDDDMSQAAFVNYGPDATKGWPKDEEFLSGDVYAGNVPTISPDTGLEMARQDDTGLVFSTAKLSGSPWSGKNICFRKYFKTRTLDESQGIRITFDFRTGEKIPQDFLLWCYVNNYKAKPFAYNGKNATITFKSNNGNVWTPSSSTDGKSSFQLDENTDYSLCMEIIKNQTSGLSDMTLAIYDAEGAKLDSAFFDSYTDMPDINSLLNFTIQSQTNTNCSGFESTEYITLKNVRAEGVYEGRDSLVSGDNTIVIPWKNSLADESFTSTFIAVTEISDGDVISVDDISVIKFEDVTGESGEHVVTVNVPDAAGRSLKIYAVNDVEGMVALSSVYELK